MQTTTIRTIGAHDGQEVRVRGWLYNKREKGKLVFLIVRDGTGYLQAVVFQPEGGSSVFERCSQVPQASALERTGVPGACGDGVWPRLLLRADLPRREVEDAPAPHRVLDGGAGGGVRGAPGSSRPGGGLRRRPRGAGPGPLPRRAQDPRARHGQ